MLTDMPYEESEWSGLIVSVTLAGLLKKNLIRMKFARPINEGWLYSKDKDSIKLFASYDKDEDGITFGDRTMIPRAWVKKIQKI